ncbi:MAG: hypothetical protein DRQ88_00655 [Epsilonproteobacteria bacterium]|nr:MAG: hypothetical protein DRQ89_03735 [Campylobacterota bacterium]RLA68146.1 MAG: hypothetical protein DRQ88_00655 [Campylobacterota bacterium]
MFFKKKSPIDKKIHFRSDFLKNSLHEWVLQDECINNSIDIFFNAFGVELFDFFNQGKKLLMIPARGQWACAIPHSDRYHLILIYPDLINILKSKNCKPGLAILAHEIGHLFLKHSDRKIDTTDAQYEADYFSYLLGFGPELIAFLKERPECQDRLKRIIQVTTKEGPH